jgi:hypothetical protein
VTSFAAVSAVLAALFVLGAAFALRTYLFVRRALRVRASVVGRLDASVDNHDPGSQSAPTTRYVVEIPRKGERPRRAALADALGGSLADRLVSDDGTIGVLYDPRRPGVVRIDSPWSLYLVPMFLCAPALLFLALLVYVWARA